MPMGAYSARVTITPCPCLKPLCLPLVGHGSWHLVPMHASNVSHVLLMCASNMCSSSSRQIALHKSLFALVVHLTLVIGYSWSQSVATWGIGDTCSSQSAKKHLSHQVELAFSLTLSVSLHHILKLEKSLPIFSACFTLRCPLLVNQKLYTFFIPIPHFPMLYYLENLPIELLSNIRSCSLCLHFCKIRTLIIGFQKTYMKRMMQLQPF